MSAILDSESPLAQALHQAIQPKVHEVGWATGTNDSALSEYIVLMLCNGKTQDQIAEELSGDLLNLGPDDYRAQDFAKWLFEQVAVLGAQVEGGNLGYTDAEQGDTVVPSMDADMGDTSDAAGDAQVPTGPKSMRNGGTNSKPRDRRMLGHMHKAMDRSKDAVLHKVRPQGGHERINTHGRGGVPTGPRGHGGGRGGPRLQNGTHLGRGLTTAGLMPMQNLPGQGVMPISPQQQMELYALLEQQARMMSQMFPGGAPMMDAQGFPQPPQQSQGRSLFDRVQPNPHHHRKMGNHKRHTKDDQHAAAQMDPASMDVDTSQGDQVDSASPDATCKYNLACANKDCKFAHQSPAAPPGTAIDTADVCSFGAACKNRKCVGRHPSPAQRLAHQTTQDCKFFPNCTNARCPFRHPSMPICRNGADCTTAGCKFTHVKTACKHHPCLNPSCVFKHVDGQQRGKFDDKVWLAEGLRDQEHLSERKFVDDSAAAPEEYIPTKEEPTASLAQRTEDVMA